MSGIKWIQKNKPKAPELTISSETIATSFTGLYNTDIKTRLVGVNISVFKNGLEVIVIELASITDVNINGYKVIIFTDDKGPVTLQFINANEATLAFDKILAAGNGEIV